MTRVAILADIHANLPALEAVLDHVDRLGVDAVFDLGDIVGYGPFPNEVVDLVRARGIPSVRGNYDEKVVQFGTHRERFASSKRVLTFRSFQWTHDAMDPDHLRYLGSLPAERRVAFDGTELLLAHECPGDPGRPVAMDTPPEQLRDFAETAAAHVVAFGHSHDAFVTRAGRVLVINAGTVGRGSRGDVRASFALLTIDRGRASASIEWVPYDLNRLLQALLAAGLPEAFVEMFRQGRQLAQVANLDTGELLNA